MNSVLLTAPGLVAVVFLISLWLHRRFSAFRKFLIPPALLGGFFLLLAGPEILNVLGPDNYRAWKTWPGFLISFLFAALILGESRENSYYFRPVLQQAVFVWFVALGQLVVGFLCALLVIVPLGGHPLMAHIIEIGWVGGHGSAAALTSVMTRLGHPDIGDLGIFSATAGLLLGGVSGIFLVNYYKSRFEFVQNDAAASATDATSASATDATSASATDVTSANAPGATSASAMGATSASAPGATPASAPDATSASAPVAADAAALALALVTVSVFLAWLLREGSFLFSKRFIGATSARFIEEFPLFSIALIFALAIRRIAREFGFIDEDVTREVRRISGIVLDLLIISALASLRLDAFSSNLGSFLLMMAAGLAFCIVTLMFFARRMLPSKLWLELGVLNYGMSTGVTALGLLLVKSLKSDVDPQTARVYGMAAPLSAPFIGGGVISFLLPELTARGYAVHLLFVLAGFWTLLLALGLFLNRNSAARRDGHA